MPTPPYHKYPVPDDGKASTFDPQRRREDVMIDCEYVPLSLQELKDADKAQGLPGSGTRGASDEAPAGD